MISHMSTFHNKFVNRTIALDRANARLHGARDHVVSLMVGWGRVLQTPAIK